MRKIKICIATLLFMVAIMFIPSLVKGATYPDFSATTANKIFAREITPGDKIMIQYEDMVENKDLYCIQTGVSAPYLTGRVAYTIKAGVVIEGRRATKIGSDGKNTTTKFVSNYNAVLSYALRKNEGYGSYNKYTNTQYGLYYCIGAWHNAVASQLGITFDYKSVTSGNTVGQQLWEEGKKYATALQQNGDGTVEVPTKVSTEIKVINQNSYTRVGPFKLSFSGKISNLKVYDDSTSLPIKKIAIWQNEQLVEITEDKIKSNQNFWIYIDNTSGHEKITKITGKVNPIKASNQTVYKTVIYFLENGPYQNMALARTVEYEPVVKSFSINYDVSLNVKLAIKKIDGTTKEVLPGAGFIISSSNKTTGITKYVALQDDKAVLVTSESKATVFKTGRTGKTKTITVPLIGSKYVAKEVIVPEGYVASAKGNITLTNNEVTTISNSKEEKKYIDLEGNVFIDGRDGKESLRDNTYDEGEGVNGVRVILKKHGKVVKEVASGYDSNGKSTGIEGHYKFIGEDLKIEISELSKYTIEFEYNGLKYESVAIQPDLEVEPAVSSKAKEKDKEREAFNTKYSTVTADTKIANGQSTNKAKGGDIIRYKSEPYTSQVIYSINSTTAKDSNGIAYSEDVYADDQYHIKAYTTEVGLDLSDSTLYDPATDSMGYINFGIYEREAPDVAIATDLVAAETSINGYTQVYPYQKRYDKIESDSAFTVEVKESDVDYNGSYERKLYESDVQYTKETNDGSELAVYLTYKVVIKNQSSSINVTVNDIVDYFSKDITGGIVAVGTDVNTLSEIPAKTNGNRYQLTKSDGIQYSNMDEDSGYSRQYITLNKEIGTGENYQFYVQYKMTSEAIRKTIDENVKFNNVFELNTVSAKSANGEIWTAVDMDSAVGNCVPSDKQTMEDDTDYAPGIDITTKPNNGGGGDGDRDDDDSGIRKISGIVFEDQTSAETQAGQERNGNGQYDAGESGISNVKVQLIDIDRGKIAYSNINGTNVLSGSDGSYTIKGFIPGNYIIKYTYGNGTGKYTAQQYKSTIYVDQARANENYANGYHDGVSTGGNKYWYNKDENDTKSEAIDNYDGEIKTLYDVSQVTINMSRTEIEKKWSEGYEDGMQHILNGTEIDNTTEIDAFTPHMGMPVEKTDTQEGLYIISNIDFGVAERARYRVQIDKVINRIKLVQLDGSILRDFTGFDNKLPENTKAIRSQRGISRGFVQFEIDSELLQTTTLLVEYGFKGTNISELEYVDEAYYKYGIVPQNKESKEVKLSIANIIDYVDNELQYADSSKMITEGKTNITNKSNGWSIIELNKDENKKYVSSDVLNALYNGNGQCTYSTILISNGLDTEMLKTGESKTISLSLNKTLVPTQDEMRYENVAEIVEVKKTWGREISMVETSKGAGDAQKLGNFDPTDPEDSTKVIKVKDPDTNYSETIIINPPTGADRYSIILYTTIGIVVLAILAAGVIIIKKKILK